MKKAPRLTFKEWKAEGTRLFGEDMLEWKFCCPICGHVQCANDFKPYKDKGADPSSAYQECLGRYSGGKKALGENPPGTPEQPCDYALYGLIQVPGAIVAPPVGFEGDGDAKVFAFAEGSDG